MGKPKKFRENAAPMPFPLTRISHGVMQDLKGTYFKFISRYV
jgi:hypothetical protein